ncbi:hypothetical protein AAVH_09667 [Aphelenchoides avenae]|nr:hypothetical protein AAVH_09667 [Aphelenchus avenae]
MKLPVEASLLILGFLGRQTLGRVLVTNRRLSGIVNRHRKTLNLPEIPIPPRLSLSLKLLAFLAVVTLLVLLPLGIVYARRSTQSRLRATGLVPESLRDVQRLLEVSKDPDACRTTCDSQWRCYAECDFKYTLQDKSQGTIAKRNCSIIGLPTANASPAIAFGLTCSFGYTVNEKTFDIKESQWASFE